jgi:glycerol-3-phosphate acyltransferase PlsY
MLRSVLTLIVAYLLGSIPWPYLVARLIKGIDIREVGTRNMGAMNVYREVGPAAGIAVILADLAKGAAAVQLARRTRRPPFVWALAGIAAIMGHAWPPWLGFRGGIGAATAAGAQAALLPQEVALVGAPTLLVLRRREGKGELMGTVLAGVPLLGWWRGRPPALWGAAAAIAVATGLRALLAGLGRSPGRDS